MIKLSNSNFVIFKDRVESLLERWQKYADAHPEIDQSQIVRSCCAEINDDYTEKLKQAEGEI